METSFPRQKWQFIETEFENWWTGKSDHPILNLLFTGADPKMKRPDGLISENMFQYSMEESPEQIAEKTEYIHRLRRWMSFKGMTPYSPRNTSARKRSKCCVFTAFDY